MLGSVRPRGQLILTGGGHGLRLLPLLYAAVVAPLDDALCLMLLLLVQARTVLVAPSLHLSIPFVFR
jgi:hypothetical protein